MSSRVRGVGLLLVVTAIWGTTFPLLKTLSKSLSPEAIVTTRFALAAVLLVPWLRNMNRQLFLHGSLLGVAQFGSFATQTIGLETVSAGRAAFVTGLNVIIVPLVMPLLGRGLQRIAIISALMALFGLALLSWDSGALRFSVGDLWLIGCAACYAAYVLLLERYAGAHPIMGLTAIQVVTVAACGLMWVVPSGLGENLRDLKRADAGTWTTFLYLSTVALVLTFSLHAKAQQLVSAATTVVVFAMEPVFGAIASYLWLDERLARLGYVGAALIVIAMIVSQRQPSNKAHVSSVAPS